MLMEVPHFEIEHSGIALMSGEEITGVDLRIERLPISQEEKKALLMAYKTTGLLGELNGRLYVFDDSERHMRLATPEESRSLPILPPEWDKIAFFIRE